MDKKGILWWEIYDILKINRTPFILLENVDRLLKSPSNQRGRDFGIILSCFAKLNYSVEWRVINAAEYGNIQKRKKIFIFAYQNNTVYSKNISTDISNMLSNSGFFATAFPIHNNINIIKTTIDYQDMLNISNNFEFNFENTGYMTNGTIYTLKTNPILETSILLKSILKYNVSEKYFIKDKLDKWKYLKGSKAIECTSKKGYKYI